VRNMSPDIMQLLIGTKPYIFQKKKKMMVMVINVYHEDEVKRYYNCCN
jgi:hypothetical protein